MSTGHTSNPARQIKGNRKCIGFTFTSSEAKEVFVAGTFNNWDPTATPLRRYDDRHWRGEVALPPGRHEYQLVVDGCWMPDPEARDCTPNASGGVNSIVRVPECPH